MASERTSSSSAAAARSPSPTGSFYAMSDDEEGEYNTITHTDTGRGVKLLYSKSKVYIHPTPSAKDNIPGYIALLQQKGIRENDRPTSSFRYCTDHLYFWVNIEFPFFSVCRFEDAMIYKANV